MRARQLSTFTFPAVRGGIWQTELIENPPDYGVGHGVDRSGATVKRWNRREHNRARFQKRHHVSRVDETPRSLARNEDELPAFFQKNVRGAQERGVAATGRDPAERGHRARRDHHRIETGRTTDERNVEIVFRVLE